VDGWVDIGIGGCGLGDAVPPCCGTKGKGGADVCVGVWGVAVRSGKFDLGGGGGGAPGLFTYDSGRDGGVDAEA
jgi:hypothetical protein